MNVVLLTDDYYLKNGMQLFAEDYNFLSFRSIHLKFEVEIEKTVFPSLGLTPETLFIIAIQNDDLRLRVCKNNLASYSRAVFMFDSPEREMAELRLNDVFISKKITLYALFRFLQKCCYGESTSCHCLMRKSDFLVKDLHLRAFDLLTEGFAIDTVAQYLDVKPKRLYMIRDQIISKYNMGTSGSAFRMHILKKIINSREHIGNN